MILTERDEENIKWLSGKIEGFEYKCRDKGYQIIRLIRDQNRAIDNLREKIVPDGDTGNPPDPLSIVEAKLVLANADKERLLHKMSSQMIRADVAISNSYMDLNEWEKERKKYKERISELETDYFLESIREV